MTAPHSMDQLSIVFGAPEHGWLGVEVSTANGTLREDVSDVPGNTLAELVGCLTRIASGSQHERLEWSLEPEFWEWTFDVDGDEIDFRMNLRRRGTSAVRVSKDDLLRTACRSLLRLEAEPAWRSEDAESRVWSWEFPDADLAKLRSMVLRS